MEYITGQTLRMDPDQNVFRTAYFTEDKGKVVVIIDGVLI
jgi:hypothetical protein